MFCSTGVVVVIYKVMTKRESSSDCCLSSARGCCWELDRATSAFLPATVITRPGTPQPLQRISIYK